MLQQLSTHYFPWDDPDDVATCGHRVTAADIHSPQPTCPACAVALDALDAAIEDAALPLDADEARTALDPLLNAGIPARPMSPFGAELFAYATALVRRQAGRRR